MGSALTLMFNYQSRGHLADELYMSDLYWPGMRMSADKTVDQFISESGRLKSSVDAERSKLLSTEGDGEGEPD